MKSSSTQAHQAIWDDVKGQVMRFLKFLLTTTGQAKHKTNRQREWHLAQVINKNKRVSL